MTAIVASSLASVEQFLADLRNDHSLQSTICSSSTEEILGLCQQRGIYVNAQLLGQFLAQVADEESADEELSLDQLEDVAGGLGVADAMVSGVVLAVVASNAGGLMSQAQAAMGVSSDGPVASLTAEPPSPAR